MLKLALSMIRARKGGFAGAFIALLFATTLVAACGILLETGLRAGIPAERYAAASVVVAGDQRVSVADGESGDIELERFPERVRVDPAVADRIGEVDGVVAVVADLSFPAHVVTDAGDVLHGPEADGAGGHSWGHPWDTAPLTPFGLVRGDPPGGPGDVVLDADLARRAGVDVGAEVSVQAASAPRRYRVSGIATPAAGDGLPRQAALFFSAAHARALAGTDLVDAIGVVSDQGADVERVADDVRAALSEADLGLQVHAGDERGAVEFLDMADAREMLIALAGSFGGVALLVALFVVASTFALLGQQRAREVALLRAVAATPRQVRRMISREAQLVAGVAGVLGAVPATALAGWMRAEFVERGLLPRDFELAVGPLPFIVTIGAVVGTAWLAVWASARRASRIQPVAALGEAAVEPKPIGRGRIIAGCIAMAGGVALLIAGTQLRGESAAALGASTVIPLVTAAALFAPVLARGATAVLGPLIQQVSRRTGALAVANAQANSRRLGSVITPLVLAVGVAGVLMFQQTTMDHAAQRQARDGLLAERVVLGEIGLPVAAAAEVARIPGVASAAAVVQTGVAVEYREFGDATAQVFPAQGVSADAFTHAVDLDVREGSLDELGPGTVAVSRLAADTVGAEVGEPLHLRLGDGTRAEPVVVAIYTRGLGFGDFTFAREALDGHLTESLDGLVLVRLAADAVAHEVDAALAELPFAGVSILDRAGFEAVRSAEHALDAWVSLLVGGVLLGYIAISVANSLVLGTVARARELALLRMVGGTRRQVLRMMRWEAGIVVVAASIIGALVAGITLTMLSLGLTGEPVAHVPPAAGLALLAGVAALGMAAVIVPTRHMLRSSSTETISMRE